MKARFDVMTGTVDHAEEHLKPAETGPVSYGVLRKRRFAQTL
jgi:hypothetical protein